MNDLDFKALFPSIEKYEKNPRKISQDSFNVLKDSLKKYGDLGGIIIDCYSNQVIGGNQRSEALNLNSKNLIIDHIEPDITDALTIAWGHIMEGSERFPIRFIYCEDDHTRDVLNLAANKMGGDFDLALLTQFTEEAMLEADFSPEEIEKWLTSDGEQGDFDEDDDFPDEDDEPNPEDYIVTITFNPLSYEDYFPKLAKLLDTFLGVDYKVT